jgi:hypothetical protein
MDLGVGVDGMAFDYRVIQVVVALPKILNLFGLLADDGLLQVDATVGLIGVGFKRSNCPVKVADG